MKVLWHRIPFHTHFQMQILQCLLPMQTCKQQHTLLLWVFNNIPQELDIELSSDQPSYFLLNLESSSENNNGCIDACGHPTYLESCWCHFMELPHEPRKQFILFAEFLFLLLCVHPILVCGLQNFLCRCFLSFHILIYI